MTEDGVVHVRLSSEGHSSLAFSCADELLGLYADQILAQEELAVAYPCLNCRGGLSLFLAYLSLAIEENSPGKTPAPILVYPGTAEIRESYVRLKVQIGALQDALRHRRVRAGRGCFIHSWEEILFAKLKKGTITKTDEFPLHDFFPAAVLREDGSPLIFAGRDGFGRGKDDAIPPLQFATRILSVQPAAQYRAAVFLHDAVESRSELLRLQNNLGRVSAKSRIHLFESPYSPSLRKLAGAGTKVWRMEACDFSSGKWPVPCDGELRQSLIATRRTHSILSIISSEELNILWGNLKKLRNVSGSHPGEDGTCTLLNSLYWLIVTLPVPVDHYNSVVEQYGWPTLFERIDEIKDAAHSLGPGVAYSLVDQSLQILGQAVERLTTTPSRAAALLSEVRCGLRNERRLGIVVSRSVYAAAIERFLAAELGCDALSLPEKGIHVVDVKGLLQSPPFDTLIIHSYRGERVLRWFFSGRAKEFVVIMTEAERRIMSRHLRTDYLDRGLWSPVTPTTSGASVHGDEPPSKAPLNQRAEFQNPATSFEISLEKTAEPLPHLSFDDEILLTEISDHRSVNGHRASGSPASAHSLRVCRKVVFRGKFAFLPVDSTATVLGRGGSFEKNVEDLHVGDVVVFVNGDERDSIYELMLDEIRKSPIYTAEVDIIQAWHRRLQNEYKETRLSIAALHRKLQKVGSTVVPLTVAGWIRGSVMSPMESDNLNRLFTVLGIANPGGAYSRRIDAAAKKLRNVYRQYSRAVNAFLLQTAGDERPEVETLIEKYNLDIEAIREAIIIEEIEEIAPETFRVSSATTGHLHAI